MSISLVADVLYRSDIILYALLDGRTCHVGLPKYHRIHRKSSFIVHLCIVLVSVSTTVYCSMFERCWVHIDRSRRDSVVKFTHTFVVMLVEAESPPPLFAFF